MFCRSVSSGKFEFVSGKCQGILFFPFCMNPADILKCFRESLRLRDNESRLYFEFRVGFFESQVSWCELLVSVKDESLIYEKLRIIICHKTSAFYFSTIPT